mmetsp:Transcript_43094/g.104295  ORF Transcript_43094/g.104295 Transcript_43094/m.104295 type:complete len:128 (+) Transcript_43094:739-1122(+)
MFNMVHGNDLPMDDLPYSESSSSSKGKGSIYYDEFDMHGKGGKSKGGTGKTSSRSKSKGGNMNHDSDSEGNMESNDGAKGGPSSMHKVSKKSSSSGSQAYRREHRLTMPPQETNSHGGTSSEKSRRH